MLRELPDLLGFAIAHPPEGHIPVAERAAFDLAAKQLDDASVAPRTRVRDGQSSAFATMVVVSLLQRDFATT